MIYTYRQDVLRALLAHGVRPTPATNPELVRAFVRDLYRYEIRRLRRRLLHGEIPKADYIQHVIALRRKYWLLSVPTVHWARAGD